MASLLVYDVVRVLQGAASVVVYTFDYGGCTEPQDEAERLCATLNRLAADRLCTYVVEEREAMPEGAAPLALPY
jgi:hypothetical protein